MQKLGQLVAPYHVVVKPVTNGKGRIGVSYGVAIDNGYRSRFIDGYTVHPRLSGPKLQAIFKKQSQSKLLPMHRKRLEKQVLTTLQLFKRINPKDFTAVLKAYQKIEAKVLFDKDGKALNFTIFDKSGYLFQSSEISSHIGFGTNPVLVGDDSGIKTELDLGGKQMVLEVRKLIGNAFYTAYLNGYKEGLLSEFVRGNNINGLMPFVRSSESFAFLNTYLHKNRNSLETIVKSEFDHTKNAIYVDESKKEKEVLHRKAPLIKNVFDQDIFDVKTEKAIVFDLLQSLGVKYVRGNIAYLNSNRHQVSMAISNFSVPETAQSYVSTGFINQNEKVLDALVNDLSHEEAGINGSAIFLPVIFPRLYMAMSDNNRRKFDKLSLKAYQNTAEKLHAPFEKSAKDYIRLFNHKGFYFIKKDQNIFLHSIYSKFPEGIPLLQKTEMYLSTSKDLDALLNGQRPILDDITRQGQGHLKNLWVSYLIEKRLYDKAAFMIANDGIRPNLAPEILKFHLENGLREKIVAAANNKVNAKLARLMRRSVYAFSSLLGKSSYHKVEVFNGFRDELTDYGRFKGNFV